ncbi:phosphotyrosine protein phosphatase I superfamily [Pisolithus croceorrhizus]|nr:phosphotyrosine protein phosphatase I superfamily [Pisolithus croceorrhizus]KAI6119827.1 phosphotyrosine protein phosphatase I superfamily [Pisolithus croceorrhizus]
MTLSVLIVCLGNICRSPMGEAVLKHEAEKRGIAINVDSAGTGAYHVGEPPDERTVATCREHNIPVNHLARQVEQSDFKDFQYILAADESNLRNLEAVRPRSSTAELRLWGSYLDNKPIPDPYYGGITGFQRCLEQCTKLSNAFLDEVEGK